MAILKCKMCGGDIQATDSTYGTCESCGSVMTLPKTSDERKANLFNRANHFRRLNEFDKAAQTYENILNEDNTDAEAHWGVVLSRYGIEYVEDPAGRQMVPTCHRVQTEPVLTDADYLAALEYAPDEYTKSLYEDEAKKISVIQKDIWTISNKEEPYDVFICYKETTDGGSRTKDSTIAQDIYYQLTNDGYRVFFAKITLEDKLGQQYEPYIFSALNSAKVMLVIGTRKEYFEAVWVKNEWSRFLGIMKKDRSKLLIPCYRDMDAYDLPDELSNLQSQDMSRIGFMQDILRGIKKIIDASKIAEKNSEPTAARQEPATRGYEQKPKERVIKDPKQQPVKQKTRPLLIVISIAALIALWRIVIMSGNISNNNAATQNLIAMPVQTIEIPVTPEYTAPAIISIPSIQSTPEDFELPSSDNTVNTAATDPEYIPPFRGDPSEFIKNLNNQLELAYFEDNLESAYGILESAVPRIEFDNPDEHNILYRIMERICRAEDIKSLTLLAENGLDLNLRDNDGNTILSQSTPSLTFLKAMIELGADPNQRSEYNWESALTRAVKQKKEPESLYLISVSDPEKLHLPEYSGGTPFHLACENNLFDAAQTLLDKGFDIDTAGYAPKSGFSFLNSYESKTALMISCETANKDAVDFLLQNGADPRIADKNGNSLIHLTLALRDSSSLSIPQLDLIITNRIQILNLLVTAGADVNAKSRYGTTPLMMMVDSPNLADEQLLEALIQLGADPSLKNDGGQAPLHAVSEWGFQTTARFLILKGADVNAKDNNGNTPLSIARRQNNTGLISLYLSVGAEE